jgi:flagellar basal-body rod protein FlgB
MRPESPAVRRFVRAAHAENSSHTSLTQEGLHMINRLTHALNFQAEALVLRSERQRLLASNIANADTPGDVARDFDFASALQAAAAPGAGPQLSRRADAILRYAAPSQTNLDGNSVDMDRERASFADNTVKYESTLRFINGSVRTMLDAMKSHTSG